MLIKGALYYMSSSVLDSIPDKMTSSQGCLLQPGNSTLKSDSVGQSNVPEVEDCLSDCGFTMFYLPHLVQLLAYSTCQEVFFELI